MLFKLTYVLFFIATFLYGSLQIVGPITPRHLMTLVMFALCFREGMPRLDKYMMLYLVFVTCYLFSGVVHSAYFADTLKWFFAQHFVAIVAYQATRILVEKYNGARWLLYTYLGIGIIDAIVTIGQFHIGPYAEVIMKMINNNTDTVQLDASEYHGGDSMAGFVPPGIVGSVPNGYLLTAVSILSLYSKKAKIRLWSIPLLCLFLYALFCLQEKTALIAGTVLSFFLIYKLLISSAGDNLYKKSLVNLSYIGAVFLVIIFALAILANNDEMRYNNGFEMTDERSALLLNAVKFISENPFGGMFEYTSQNHGLPPHNLFLNAFVSGGYLGGLCIMIILIWNLIKVVPVLLGRLTKENYITYIFCLVYAGISLNSITHNASIVAGDFYFFAFLAVFMYSVNELNKTGEKNEDSRSV